MGEIVLSEKLLAGLAGWEVVQQARGMVAQNRVLSSHWGPPVLRGVVQSGTTSYRAGLVIHRENDAENLCTCRPSREWGTLCAHSVAVGLHAIKPAAPGGGPAGTAARPAAATGPGSVRVGSKDARRLRRAPEGEPLEIHVILPPNLAEGLERGRGTAFFEGEWSRGRTPLAAVPMDREFRLGPEDVRLLEAVELLSGGDTPSMVQVGAADFGVLIEALVGHPRVTVGKSRALTVTREVWRAPLRASLKPGGEIVVDWRGKGRPPVVVTGDGSAWVMGVDGVRPLGLPKECLGVLAGPMRYTRAQVPSFLSGAWRALERGAEVEADFAVTDFVLAPQAPRFELRLEGGLALLTAHLQCVYGARVMTVGMSDASEGVWLPDPQDPRRYGTRDLAAEKAALGRLTRYGFTGPDGQGRYRLAGQNPVLTFLAREYGRLEREWKVTLDERLERSAEKNLERIEPRFAIASSGEQWFDLQVSFGSAGGERLPMTEVQRLLRGGQSYTRLGNGKVAVLDTGAVEELEQILIDAAPRQHEGGYRLSQAQAGFVEATLREQGWEPQAPASWRERARMQTGEVALADPPLGPLEGVLRPYQKRGVAWLGFLREHGFGGILADEMGLGKTLQALAHLGRGRAPGAARREEGWGVHLVVCPTSVVSNWVAEAGRFAPWLRVLALEGPGREGLFERIGDSDLVVTSYALIRRDLERYRGTEFDTVVLDEAQHIKNRQTLNAQAVKSIRSRHRLVLTGTPLENSVLDLWSLFDFLMPGYLGGAQDFRDRYEVPIVRERDPSAQARLARRVRPFLLRRLKREVAPELPARIDQVVWCDLTEAQSAVYRQLLEATRREVTEAVGAQGLARGRMVVLTALLRLRQACCDLRLLGVDAEDGGREAEDGSRDAVDGGPEKEGGGQGAGEEGGKMAAFLELLEEVLDGGHRVLVFSQFTRVLALLREALEREKVRFEYLDGATRDRGEVVGRFQGTPDIPVFLISLKAGGVGLNLTAADTVIHFDPWWNPAVEDQATDRAHRIGQSRVVTSYKLIARGTVEEKILQLQQRKREVLKGVLSGEEQLAGSLTLEEMQELLA